MTGKFVGPEEMAKLSREEAVAVIVGRRGSLPDEVVEDCRAWAVKASAEYDRRQAEERAV